MLTLMMFVGRYRIRITLMRMDYSDETSEGVAIVEEYVDSRTITVDEGTTSFEPSKYTPCVRMR